MHTHKNNPFLCAQIRVNVNRKLYFLIMQITSYALNCKQQHLLSNVCSIAGVNSNMFSFCRQQIMLSTVDSKLCFLMQLENYTFFCRQQVMLSYVNRKLRFLMQVQVNADTKLSPVTICEGFFCFFVFYSQLQVILSAVQKASYTIY